MQVDFTTESLYDTLEKTHNRRVTRVRREFSAVNALQKDAELLQITRNKALILVKTVAYSGDDPNPVEFSVARYRGDINKFNVELFR